MSPRLDLHALEFGTYRFDNGASGWQDAEYGLGPGIDDDLIIDEHLELTVPPVDHGHLLLELPTQPSRHPGGMESRDSIRAVANGDPCQTYLLSVVA